MIKITEEMIGCLCEFWNDDEDEKVIGILKEIQLDHYITYYPDNKKIYYPYFSSEIFYQHCRPVKSKEIKFYKEKENE